MTQELRESDYGLKHQIKKKKSALERAQKWQGIWRNPDKTSDHELILAFLKSLYATKKRQIISKCKIYFFVKSNTYYQSQRIKSLKNI